MRRIAGILIATVFAVAIVYTSRYWIWQFWPRGGVWGIELLRPQGGLVRQALRGTPLATFDILLWALGWFAVLSLFQVLWSYVAKPGNR